MDRFDNRKSSTGIPYSRYIASWLNICGERPHRKEFISWLTEAEALSEDEAFEIYNLMTIGKYEIQERLKKHINLVSKEKED